MVSRTIDFFTLRRWQEPIWDCRSRNIVGVVHRRAGKTTLFQNRGLMTATTEDRRHLPLPRRRLQENPPRVVHVLPASIMWTRTGMWDALVRSANSIPGARVAITDKRIILPNGGVYQTGGMDEPDRWRGGYADLVIEDEADDVTAGGLDMVIVPMLTDFKGQRIKIGTPKGHGRLADAYDKAGSDEDSSRFLLRWTDTGVFDKDQIDKIRKDMDEEEFEQEFNCSFTAPNSGSYYGKWLDTATREERITKVTYDPRLPVYTCWDLGMDDYTSIWWFQRSPGGEWRWLEYHEDNGEDLTDYAKIVLEKPYAYGRHFLPEDIKVRELTFKAGRRAFLEGLGVRPIKVVDKANPADRIAAVRSIFARSFFDAEKCKVGLGQLRAYRRAWNEHMGVWRADAVHDEASHCADALGTGVQGSRDPELEAKPKLAPHVPRIPQGRTSGAWMAR
jgi:phage terminase large subunit